jgi:septum site-determining protein MinC
MKAWSQGAVSDETRVELKADSFTLPTLCMSSLDPDAIDELLRERVAKAPGFFRNTPIVMDLTDLTNQGNNGDLAVVIGAIRGYGLVPVGVRGGTKVQREQAQLMELAVFPESRRSETTPEPAQAAKPRAPNTSTTTKVVDRPVRSGQRVYAQGSDLILLATVSSGAEVVSDGHVHAYASIRGRVLAGVRGDERACIFCKDLRAELVSIAGRYKVSEDLEPRFMGRQISISLQGDALVFKKL